ncbi:hypothetical protein DFH08DRAFT_820839 [Mycena albidolilacea]|uniref:Uncharacterized protein n=1 Tax=Mycena albidolilacea TaxID=1033008 RepID=A0AAD7EDX8_9AGAR|nr:hypothetical protein DFH08DRAFT_820839 [Mycena albidolilacea]
MASIRLMTLSLLAFSTAATLAQTLTTTVVTSTPAPNEVVIITTACSATCPSTDTVGNVLLESFSCGTACLFCRWNWPGGNHLAEYNTNTGAVAFPIGIAENPLRAAVTCATSTSTSTISTSRTTAIATSTLTPKEKPSARIKGLCTGTTSAAVGLPAPLFCGLPCPCLPDTIATPSPETVVLHPTMDMSCLETASLFLLLHCSTDTPPQSFSESRYDAISALIRVPRPSHFARSSAARRSALSRAIPNVPWFPSSLRSILNSVYNVYKECEGLRQASVVVCAHSRSMSAFDISRRDLNAVFFLAINWFGGRKTLGLESKTLWIRLDSDQLLWTLHNLLAAPLYNFMVVEIFRNSAPPFARSAPANTTHLRRISFFLRQCSSFLTIRSLSTNRWIEFNPLPERYIHGGICILKCVPYLLKLLDDPGVNAFDDDTTYKRIEGKMNEQPRDATKDLQDELASELERRRESSARSKELKEQLKTLKGKGGKKAASSSTILSASSSGRVRSVPAARADASPTVATTHIDERAIGSTSAMELAEGAIHADEYNTLVFLPTPADIQHISDRRPIAEFETPAPVFHLNDSSSSDSTNNLKFLDKMLTWDFNMNAFDSAASAFNFNDSSSSDSTSDLNFLNEMLTWDFNMNAVGAEYVLADNTIAAPVSEIPTLPAPPPSSPMAIPDQSIEPLAATKPKQRCEVDENNILNTRRRHIKRTRSSDNQLFDKPTKKGWN